MTSTGTTAPAVSNATLTQRAAIASVVVATLLLGLKGVALWRTGSMAMLGSVADTTLDLVASIVTLMGVRLAAAPADPEHRYGHGKAEALASLFQVSLISIAAAGIAFESFSRLGNPHTTQAPEMGIGVSVIAILLSLVLILYQRHVIRQTGSLAINTDSLHYMSDFVLNGSVIVALVLDHYFALKGADTLFGFAIAIWLGRGAWHGAIDAAEHLMDKEWSIEDRRRFIEVASRHPKASGIHDMRTRTSGSDRFVQFHVWVDPEMSVRAAHDVMDEIEAELRKEFPGVDILIHPDPEGHIEKGGDPLRADEALAVLETSKAH